MSRSVEKEQEPLDYVQSLSSLLTGPWPTTKSLTRAQLKEEVEVWRIIATWLDAGTRYWLGHIGDTVRVVRRDYKSHLGDMLQPTFSLASIDVGVSERFFDPAQGKYFREKKVMHYPVSSIFTTEFIAERHEEEDTREEDLAEAVFKKVEAGNPLL